MSDLRRIPEAAEELRVTVRTIYREHARGRIAFVKVGASSFVRDTEIERYKTAQTRKAAA